MDRVVQHRITDPELAATHQMSRGTHGAARIHAENSAVPFETHRRTPLSPRDRSEHRNSRQKTSVSASPTSMPITSRRPLSWTP